MAPKKKPKKIIPTNESEIKYRTILNQYKQALKKQSPNVDFRRQALMTQYASNYRNEVNRLNGELNDRPLLSLMDRRKIISAKNAILANLEEIKYPIIGTNSRYNFM
jgi:hypothetical protein